MADKKADTTVEQMFTLLKQADDDPLKLTNLIDALTSTIPVKRGKRMVKADSNLNKAFHIKRIGCTVLATINTFDNITNCYEARILQIINGDTKFRVGDIIMISKRELELTGKLAIR